MKKTLTALLLSSFGMLILCMQPALAGHPLVQNGWLKSANDTSVTLTLPKNAPDLTFTFAPDLTIDFSGDVKGTAADLQAMVAQMGKERIIVNIRRDAPESTTAVKVGIKAPKPAPAPETAPAADSGAVATPATE